MDRLRRLLLITFMEGVAAVFIERGLFFYTSVRLGFTQTDNLWLALGIGVLAVAGALASHHLAQRWTEKRLLVATLIGQCAVQLVMLVAPLGAVLAACAALVSLCNGLKWPVLESYVSAGRTPHATSRAIGRFNIAWSSSIPTGLVAAGVVIRWVPPGLFAMPVAINVITMLLTIPLAWRPTHLEMDHPERPNAGQLQHLRRLLASSRWSMLGCYIMMFLLNPLMPGIFLDRLGFGVMLGTTLTAVMGIVRVFTFVVMVRSVWWHERSDLLVLTVLALPLGFFMVLFGPNTATVLVGEALFGVAAGLAYFCALYYAMVVKNASVAAGGEHEGLISTGCAIGPAVGLSGNALAGVVGGAVAGMLTAVAPLLAICAAGGLWPIVRQRRKRR